MELREALKLINDTCKKVAACEDCPFNAGKGRGYCLFDSNSVGIGDGNVDLICEAVEEAKKQAEKR